jgi:formate/nitrite transporter FocA (FNT family)
MPKTPGDMVQAATRLGCAHTDLSLSKQIVAGALAGAYLALGALIVAAGEPQADALYAVLAPVGYVLALLAGGQIFVANCAVTTPACLAGAVRWPALAQNWGVVLAANLAGAVATALLLGYAGGVARGGATGAAALSATQRLADMGWASLLLRGVGGGWLIGLAAWLALSAEGMAGRILAVWLPVAAYLAGGMAHVVVAAAGISLGLANGANLSVSHLLFSVLLPIALGNLAGAAGLLGATYWWLYGQD